MCCHGPTVTCTGGLFLLPTGTDTLLAHVVVYKSPNQSLQSTLMLVFGSTVIVVSFLIEMGRWYRVKR